VIVSTLQVVLYTVVFGLTMLFLAGALTSFVATKHQMPRIERAAGNIAASAFMLLLPVTVAAVTNNITVLVIGILLAIMMIGVMRVSTPRCAKCGERLNPLTNRQFRRPSCLFCGAPEE
jgi:hypothetical protein